MGGPLGTSPVTVSPPSCSGLSLEHKVFPTRLAQCPARRRHPCAWAAQSCCQAQVSAARRGRGQCGVGPPISGPCSAATPEAGLSRAGRRQLPQTCSRAASSYPQSLVSLSHRRWLCCDVFWEPRNLPHEAIRCTFPIKCILI